MQSRTSIVLCAVFAITSVANAQLPRVRLDSIFPPGAQIGTRTQVVIAGELADAATDLVFSHPDIEAMQQQEPESEFRVAHRKGLHFDVRVGPLVPSGRYEVRALGPAGLSAPRSFVVSRYPHRDFDGSNNSRRSPFKLRSLNKEAGEVVSATSRANERDYYQVTAEQHRPLLIQVFGQRIDSKMDAVLSVYSVDGKRLHKVRQSLTRDPILTFSPPTDGDYIIEVSDATYTGGVAYQLEVSERPWVEAVFPPVAEEGKEAPFTLYGYNLPGGLPVSGLERDGGLQSIEIDMVPEFDSTLAGRWLQPESAAIARITGQHLQLPDRLGAGPPVFLAKADQAVVRETQATRDAPQELAVPAVVAGQFYPRRDRDYYEFQAKKNDSLWIELAMEQLGLPGDPAIRVQRKQVVGDKVSYNNVANVDDIEGPPNNRNARRFYTGTADASYRFRVPDDGTYVVSVSDQYNTVLDDPRLAYRLTVRAQAPDFQLVAFADPERFPDEKIAKPNGVGLLPGGSAAIRVRLLPQYGFSGQVTVQVTGLPAGVTAAPLVLEAASKEGLLVLQAEAGAKPSLSSIQIQGVEIGERAMRRTAKLGAITHGANNTDTNATQCRLASDIPVAVLDVKRSPLQLVASQNQVVTCRGAKQPIRLELLRRDDFKDLEVTVSVIQAPPGMKVAAAKSKSGNVELVADGTDGKLKAGRHSMIVGSKVKDKRPRNPTKVAEASGDLEKVTKLFAAIEAEQAQQKQAQQDLATLVASSSQQLTAVQSRAAEPRNLLADNLTRQQQAAKSLQEQLAIAIKDVTNKQVQEKILSIEQQLSQFGEERVALQQQFGSVLDEVTALQEKLSREKQDSQQATESLAKVGQRIDTIKKEKDAAAKRLKDSKANELNKEVEFWVYAQAITVDVQSSPVTLHVQPAKVSPGATAEVPVLLQRDFGFADQVVIEAEFPANSGLSSTPLVLGKGISTGRLPVLADAEAKPKRHRVKLNVRLKFNGLEITDQTTLEIATEKK